MIDELDNTKLFQSIFESSVEGILVVDDDGSLLTINPAGEHMFGYDNGELTACRVEQLIQENLRKKHIGHRRKYIKNPMARPMGKNRNLWGLKKDGSQFPVEISLSPAVVNDHSVTIAFVKDATQQYLVEQELRANEAKSNALLEAIPDMMFIHNFRGDFLDCYMPNRGDSQVSEEDLVGKNIKEVVPPEMAREILKTHRKAIKEKEVQIREYTMQGEKGKIVYEARTVRLNNHRLLTLVRDITQNKAIQDVLHIRNRALDAAGNGILIADAQQPDLPIIYSNPAFTHMTGYRSSEALGRNCRFLQKDDRDQPGIENIRKAIKTGTLCKETLRNYRKDGTLFWNELTLTPVYDKEQRLTHFIGVQHDVTDKKKAIQLKDDIRKILEMIAQDHPLDAIGNCLVEALEKHVKGCRAAIQLVDDKGILRNLAAPHLPEPFVKAMEGLAVGPEAGCCGAAAHTKQEIFTPDIATHPLWKNNKEVALHNGFVSCWAFPILSVKDEVLGTFAVYCKTPETSLEAYKEIMADLTQLSALAIEHHDIRTELFTSRKQLEAYAQTLEQRVKERTVELKDTVQQLVEINLSLEDQIQETRSAESRARRSQALFSAIAQNFPKGVIVVFNQDFELVYVEGQELKRFNLRKGDFEGLRIDDLPIFSKEQIGKIREDVNKTLNGSHLTFELEYMGNSYTANSTPLWSDDPDVVWALFVYSNITDQKKVQQELSNALKIEQELNELKSRFISMASHEFRTPLSAILSSAILIGKQNEPGQEEKRKKHVMRIRANVRNLVVILNDFLSLSKLEEGKVQMHAQQFELIDFVKSLIDEMEVNLKEGQELILEQDNTEVLVYLDPKLLSHVLNNLFSNAIKYSEEHTKIKCRIATEGKKLLIKIKDQGIGIPKKEQKSLFQRFFRAGNVTNIQGTGLGLHIVKQYTELMGGAVRFKSKEGKGSTFIVELPLNLKRK
ncbi:PAS domain S-box protein [Flavobacteriaceae bacterium TP-CH-4]|uniref:histidine kinase n=1 Tax=Pelagihabitans pacificus TaxID=2696054 RepID=A0A967E6X4_9FLAO|nr:PAS domain S-box protein [Pelagihabitans pacificus]NHF59629.1 PAS domain S-box protein [Pelagihabitans pacificus]